MAEPKRCPYCNAELVLDEYCHYRVTTNGLSHSYSRCKKARLASVEHDEEGEHA